MDTRLLGIYLNDHLAGSGLGLELSRRVLRENSGNAVGRDLLTFVKQVEDERTVLRHIMRALGVLPNPFKVAAASVLERVGRLKLNGFLLRYSPLSRLLELEGLTSAVMGKRSMWTLLQHHARVERRLAGFDFPALIAQAESQLQMLDRLRVQAAETAFLQVPLPTSTAAPIETAAR